MSAILLEAGVNQDMLNAFIAGSNQGTVDSITALLTNVRSIDGRVISAGVSGNVLAVTFDVAGILSTATFVTFPR